ncbi:Mitochondrial-processing peptidase subunit alpha [Tulasnella sp. 419]|nr:Mitochondrial-processing peptidase subunit alpha [Tulasnella sp. 419]
MKRAFHQNVRRVRIPSKLPSCRRTIVNPAADKEPLAEVTTLPNNIRVATDLMPGHFSSVGVYIDAGSRFEAPHLSGSSHIIDRMAFKSTSNQSSDDLSAMMNSLGGQIQCSSSRETIIYQSSHFHSSTPLALSLLSDTIKNSLYLEQEVEMQKEAAAYEIREITAKPELILPELLHQLAYQGNTLGNPLLCPEERLPLINGDTLREFVNTWYRPERIVIAGAGMPHQQLVELVDKYFGDMKYIPPPTVQPSLNSTRQQPTSHLVPPTMQSQSPSLYKSLTTAANSLFNPSPTPSTLPSFAELATAKAKYTGGHQFIYRPDLDMTHLYLAFDGVSIYDDDVYGLAIIQILLGGGGSFSAGGPGKGMYSRLYTYVLNHYSSIDHCASFHHIYTDTSLFGLNLVAHPHHQHGLSLPLLAHQLSLLLYHPIPETELNRAKNQLMSSLVMALESRAIEVEDLGRQVLVHGRKVTVQEMSEKISKVTNDDLRRIGKRVFGEGMHERGPTILVMGKKDIGDWQAVFRKYGLGRL